MSVLYTIKVRSSLLVLKINVIVNPCVFSKESGYETICVQSDLYCDIHLHNCWKLTLFPTLLSMLA